MPHEAQDTNFRALLTRAPRSLRAYSIKLWTHSLDAIGNFFLPPPKRAMKHTIWDFHHHRQFLTDCWWTFSLSPHLLISNLSSLRHSNQFSFHRYSDLSLSCELRYHGKSFLIIASWKLSSDPSPSRQGIVRQSVWGETSTIRDASRHQSGELARHGRPIYANVVSSRGAVAVTVESLGRCCIVWSDGVAQWILHDSRARRYKLVWLCSFAESWTTRWDGREELCEAACCCCCLHSCSTNHTSWYQARECAAQRAVEESQTERFRSKQAMGSNQSVDNKLWLAGVRCSWASCKQAVRHEGGHLGTVSMSTIRAVVFFEAAFSAFLGRVEKLSVALTRVHLIWFSEALSSLGC